MTNRIQEIANIKSALKGINHNTWVFFDLDNTVMESTLQLGGDQWFSHLIKHTPKPAQRYVFTLYYALQSHIKMQAAESKITLIIKALQDIGIPVFALTARDEQILEPTIKQLLDIGVDFSRIKNKELQDHKYRSGIICCNGQNKGDAITLFLNSCEIKPSHIVMFDDKNQHLVHMETATEKMKIEFSGFRYGFLDAKVAQFNIDTANKELDRLKKQLPLKIQRVVDILKLISSVDSVTLKKISNMPVDKSNTELSIEQFNLSQNLEESIKVLKQNRTAPNKLVVPLEHQLFACRFEEKIKNRTFLGGRSNLERSAEVEQFRRTRRMSLFHFNQGIDHLKPRKSALQRTEKAVKCFFQLAHQVLTENKQIFPLANHNKCLGMVALPERNLVILAISQNKNPEQDKALRTEMVSLIEKINLLLEQNKSKKKPEWVFSLAHIPTLSQYLIPRTLSKDNQFPASKEQIEPHTRCVEVALMVALNKMGRFETFKPSDIGILALGGALWASNSKDNSHAINYFEGETRNIKYVTKDPIEVKLNNERTAWVDIWEPCECHCKIYQHQMTAIAASGGPATSFAEPCLEQNMRLLV